MSDDLFSIPHTPSPYLEFLARHDIVIAATTRDTFLASQTSKGGVKETCEGPTEKDAVLQLATILELPGRSQVNWD